MALQQNELRRGMRVWVSILPKPQPGERRTAGTAEPAALAPAIVTDPQVMNRTIVRGDGPRLIQNAVDAISFNRLDDGREFYKRQAQGAIGLTERTAYVPAIDGPVDEPISKEWAQQLLQLVDESTDSLVTAPSDALIAAAEAKYAATTQEPVTA